MITYFSSELCKNLNDRIKKKEQAFELVKAKINTLQSSKKELEEQLKRSEALVAVLNGENKALRKKTAVLKETANSMTTAIPSHPALPCKATYFPFSNEDLRQRLLTFKV